MSIEVPENMEEVAMRTALLKTRGQDISENQVIKKAVFDALQMFVDQELDGHYDEVQFDGEELVIFDLMHNEIERVSPDEANFEADFKKSADKTLTKIEAAAHHAVGSR